MEVEEILRYVLSFLDNIKSEEAKTTEELRIKELEQQDLLHELEISKLNACEMSQVTKQLVQVRKERRVIKNDLQKLVLLRRFAEKQKTRNLHTEINTLLKEINKTQNMQIYGKYQPRVLKNLKCGSKNTCRR